MNRKELTSTALAEAPVSNLETIEPNRMNAAVECGFRVVKPDHEGWDQYVCKHAKGSIFHTSGMIRAYEQTRGVEPYARAAVDAEGRIVALLVSYHVKTLELVAPVSSRAVQFAEPLCESDPIGLAALTHLVGMHDRYMRTRALYCEVRSILEPGTEKEALLSNGYEHHDYVNYLVDLRFDSDVLWSNLHKKLRQQVRSAARKGVEIRDDETPEGIERLYGLLQASYRRARIPLPDVSLFTNTLKQLPREQVRLRTAFLNGNPIASIISLAFGDRVFSWYGGTLRLGGLSPFASIVWDDIKWGSRNGFSYYDFGGAGWPNEDYGPRGFKARFGGQEVRFGRYTRTYSKVRLRLAELGFNISRRIGVWS